MAAETPAISSNYAMGHHASVLKAHGARTAPTHAAYLLPHIQPTDTILDVGCGPGSITVGLASLVAQGHVVGLDYSSTAIAAATSLGVARGVMDICEFVTGDAYQLGWPDGTFDIVHSHQCLIHLEDPVGALKEMRRVCKVGGIVAVRDADFGTFVVYPDTPLLARLPQIFAQVIRARGSEPNNGRRLAALARQAGFQRADCSVSAAAEVSCSAEEREFTAARWCERLLHSDVGRVAAEVGVATKEEVGQVVEAWRAWAGDEDGYFGMTHTEIVCRKVS